MQWTGASCATFNHTKAKLREALVNKLVDVMRISLILQVLSVIKKKNECVRNCVIYSALVSVFCRLLMYDCSFCVSANEHGAQIIS